VISRLTGRLLDKGPNRIVIDVHGVGYDVQIPLTTFYGLGEPGAEVSLRVHTHVREDALALYGFSTGLELKLFEQLIGVSGIGPRLALSVLSGIESTDLVRAVRHGDVGRLTAIPGVGKKTAERIGLELKDRLKLIVEPEAEDSAQSGAEPDMRGDLLSALLNLGYHRQLADRAVDAALAGQPGTFEQVLRQALKELAR
jgi:Holliday junction DNA helicase RuvA